MILYASLKKLVLKVTTYKDANNAQPIAKCSCFGKLFTNNKVAKEEPMQPYLQVKKHAILTQQCNKHQNPNIRK